MAKRAWRSKLAWLPKLALVALRSKLAWPKLALVALRSKLARTKLSLVALVTNGEPCFDNRNLLC